MVICFFVNGWEIGLESHCIEESVVERAHVYFHGSLVHHVDEGDEEETLETVKVEIVDRSVTGQENDDFVLKEAFKEAL